VEEKNVAIITGCSSGIKLETLKFCQKWVLRVLYNA